MHNKGIYWSFLAAAAAKSYVTVLLNPEADFIKVFDNFRNNSEISLSGTDTAGKTLSKLEFYIDYQQLV